MKKTFNEGRARTGLKFGYPDGYYRFQYPPAYSMPKSATAALDLEIEKIYASKESPVGIPKLIKNPKGMISFKEWMSSKEEK
jgi:hypothetical protein